MIEKGKKAGDIVNDGDSTYKIIEILPGGYILESAKNEPKRKVKDKEESAEE